MIVDACENPYVLGIILFIEEMFKVVYYLVPIGLILFVSIDFVKGIIHGEEKVSQHFNFSLKRVINTIGLFLVPTFIGFFMELVGDADLFKGDYATCLANTSNISEYKLKYDALVEEEENRLEELRQKQLEEMQYNNEVQRKRAVAPDNTNNDPTDESRPVTVGQTFKLTDEQIEKIAALCISEQGANKAGVAGEASVMANIYEKSGKNYSGFYDFVMNSGWWGKQDRINKKVNERKKELTPELISATKDVLINGNRTLPLYIDEHDCWFCANHYKNDKLVYCNNGNKGDICYLDNKGSKLSSKADISNRSNYKQDVTKVYTYYKQGESSESARYWVFYTFLTSSSDPFGYTEYYYKKIKGIR